MEPPTLMPPEHEVTIRELRNAGRVVAELAGAGAIGRITSSGRLVGWLVPASAAEQRLEALLALGRLRPSPRSGLAGHRPLPRRTDVAPLTETLANVRADDDR